MDFRSLNKFNVLMNTATGNFLPLTGENADLPLRSSMYLVFVWLIDVTYVTTMLIGLLCYLPLLEAIRSAGVVVITCAEVIFLATYLLCRRKFLRNFVRNINNNLEDSDVLRRCIRDSIEPHKKRLKLYAVMNMSSWLIWEGTSLEKVLQTDQFTYTDFKLSTYFPGAPFTVNTFVIGVIFRLVGGGYIMFKKIGVDVYINYCITLLTAEYRYLEERIAAALREKDEIAVTKALKECIVYHCNTIETGDILVDILAVNIGVIYFNCIFRFCCIAFMMITLQTPFNMFLNAVFLSGLLMQMYLLCSSIQDLLEASQSITKEAFYEDWYGHGPVVRSIFRIIGLGNKMECRLTAFRLFDITVPTMATILKQSYSACLVLMRIQ